MTMSENVNRIEIEPKTDGYRVWHDGDVLIERSHDPEYDACRVLLSRGVVGTLITKWKDAAYDAMRLDIEKGAKWTATGARLRPFVERRECAPSVGKSEQAVGGPHSNLKRPPAVAIPTGNDNRKAVDNAA